jgi:hypothetical protein
MSIRSLIGIALLAAFAGGCEKAPNAAAPVVSKAATQPVQRISEVRPKFFESQPFVLGGKCNMETVNGAAWGADVVDVNPGMALVVTGWAVDGERKMHPQNVSFRVQDAAGKEYYAVADIVSRQDVAEFFKEDYFSKGGYKVVVDLSALPGGTYSAMIVMDVGGKSILCASGRSFRVKGA